MTQPKPWRVEASPHERAAADLVSRLSEPTVPTRARARVWKNMQAPSKRAGHLVPAGLGAVCGMAILMLWLAPRASVPGDSAAPSNPVAVAPEVWTSHGEAQSLQIEGLAQFTLSPGTRLIRGVPQGLDVELANGRVRLVGVQAGLRLMTGRYMVRPGPDSDIQVVAAPFAIVVAQGWADVSGPDGTQRMRAPEPEPQRVVPKRPSPKVRRGRPQAHAEPPREAAVSEDMGALYRQARTETDPERAVALFDRICTQGGSWAEMAGHQAVRRRVAQGRSAEALVRLNALQAQFPTGAHVTEVWLGRIDIHVSQGKPGAALADLDRYLAQYSRSLRASDLFFLRAEIHRKAGRQSEAKADYQRVQRGNYLADAQAALAQMKKD